MFETASALRYLCSCDAERISDYQRINQFVKWAHRAANLLEDVIRKDANSEAVKEKIANSAFRSGLVASIEILQEELEGYDEDMAGEEPSSEQGADIDDGLVANKDQRTSL